MNGPALAFFLRAGDFARAAGLRAGLAARFGAGERERRVATILQRCGWRCAVVQLLSDLPGLAYLLQVS